MERMVISSCSRSKKKLIKINQLGRKLSGFNLAVEFLELTVKQNQRCIQDQWGLLNVKYIT